MKILTNPTPEQSRRANSIARKAGYGRATKIWVNEPIDGDIQPKVLSHISYGYRKYSTGEYVPNSYLKNFGWKNTYYQQAETVVLITR